MLERDQSVVHESSAIDRAELLVLDRQLADAVTFLPPTMRATFHARVGALLKLTQKSIEISESHPSFDARSFLGNAIDSWRRECERISQRSGRNDQ